MSVLRIVHSTQQNKYSADWLKFQKSTFVVLIELGLLTFYSQWIVFYPLSEQNKIVTRLSHVTILYFQILNPAAPKMGMGLSTKAKSSGSCESDQIEEEKNFSQVSDEDTDDDTDSKKAKGRFTLHCLAAA